MRSRKNSGKIIFAIALLFALVSPTAQAVPSNAELLEIIESMQQQIDELKLQLEKTQDQGAETDAKVEAVAEVMESSTPLVPEKSPTTIGGYGELHYNNHSARDPSRDLERIDFHRFVLFFGHEFNDRTRFYSEVELEHAYISDTGGNTPGEVEVEQAFVEFDLRQNLYAKAGLFLIPVGILNETHEPPTFYGVERNDVESIIVPSTWWEGGAGLNGRWGSSWNWDLAFTSGLEMSTSGNNAFRVRSGRQKVANAVASDGAITGRLRYLGIPGLQAAVTLQYQFDPSQVANDGLDDGTLLEAHVDYRRGGFGLRALYARWDFSGDAVEEAGADVQTGWYIEPSYRLNRWIGLYTRYEEVDAARDQDRFNQWQVGLNWWPTDNVVFKLDYRDRSHDLASARGRDFTGIDLGVGYNF
jgi:hypothetical protein